MRGVQIRCTITIDKGYDYLQYQNEVVGSWRFFLDGETIQVVLMHREELSLVCISDVNNRSFVTDLEAQPLLIINAKTQRPRCPCLFFACLLPVFCA
jgi:hypothetical protein